MRMKMLGAASIAAIALVACAKKDETKAVDTAAVATTAPAPEATDTMAAPADVVAEPTDVYAAPTTLDISSVRSKDILTATSDAAFAQSDVDADGALSKTEFYSLASLMTPAVAAADTMMNDAADSAMGAAADKAGSVVGDVAGAPAGEATTDAINGMTYNEPAMDTVALDASYATIAGADSSLSMDDLRAAFLSRFDAADANLDGSLDDAEAATFKAASVF